MATSALSVPVAAKAAQNAVQAAPQGGVTVGELIVTARKRSERLIDVPISIAVNTAADIKNKNINDLTDLAEKMPNVNGGGTFSAGFTIRGISTASAGSGFPPDVGVNVDGVFMGRDRAFDTALVDVASIDLLYGPQGTLYGKNTIAGVINITTNRPTDQYEAIGDFKYGNYDYAEFRGVLSGPIIDDKLLARASFIDQSRGGFIWDPTLNEHISNLHEYGGRVMIVAKPSDQLTIELRGDVFKEQDSNGVFEVQHSLDGPTCAFYASLGLGCNVAFYSQVPPQNPTDRIVDDNTPPRSIRTMWGTSAKVDYTTGGYDFVSITAFRLLHSDDEADQDGSNLDGFDTGQSEMMHRFSQEFRITSPATKRLSWILGAYFDDEVDHADEHIRLGDAFPTFLFGPPFPNQLPAGFQEAAASNARISSNSWAVFASGNLRITDKLKLSGGLRYTDEHKTLNFAQQPILPVTVGAIFAFAELIPPLTESINNPAVSGDASLSYSFTPDEVAYFRFAHGFKAGGFQSDIISPPQPVSGGLSFKPEYLNAYEVGFKSVFLNHTLSADLSAFYYDFSNKQEEINTGVSFVVSNAASATSEGVEASLVWQPTRSLQLFANGGYLNAYYNYFPNGGGVGINYTNHILAGASRYSASWGATFTTPTGFWQGVDFYAATDSDYRSRQFTDPANTPDQEVQPFLIVNARVGLEAASGRWGIYLWGENLTNETVLGGGVDVVNGIFITRSINIGRTYGIELRAHL
ncbi:MAG: TonB-dependent receptor [Caulobacteraceae bacterium]